jgi:hypothetical protein
MVTGSYNLSKQEKLLKKMLPNQNLEPKRGAKNSIKKKI